MRAIALLLVLTAPALLAACQASQERFATETSEARITVPTTPTNTPSGELLMVDGDPVLRVYVPSSDDPAFYAQTETWLYRKEGNEWVTTNTRTDERTILVDRARPERLFRGNHPVCTNDTSAETDPEPITFSKSTDSGETWRVIPEGVNIQPLVIDPTLGDVIYGSDCGLAISTDAGETWRAYYHAQRHTVVDAAVVGERLLVLEISVTGRGRVRAINVTVPEDPEMVNILFETGIVYDLDAGPERIVVGGIDGVAFSEDSGENWTTSRKGLEDVTVDGSQDVPPRDNAEDDQPEFGVLAVRLDPAHSNRIFAGTVRGLYISQDAGLTWDVYSQVHFDARVIDIQFAAGGNDVYVTTPDGVIVVPNP